MLTLLDIIQIPLVSVFEKNLNWMIMYLMNSNIQSAKCHYARKFANLIAKIASNSKSCLRNHKIVLNDTL